MFKVFIDGEAGTTGLRIRERLESRDDITLLTIDPELRKDLNERKKLINSADIVFLCLPDDASREAVTLLDNNHTRIIDASTAHRTDSNWAYGFPELGDDFLNKIKTNQLVAVPGCYASGFMSIVYPLVKLNIASKDYPFSANAISGYSGAGKKGMPFRNAYKISGSIVFYCISNDLVLEDVKLDEYKKYSDLFDKDVYEYIDLETCTFKRTSKGASSIKSVEEQISYLKNIVKE